MYKDWQHFLSEAESIVTKFGVKYSRVTSGYDKGKYSSKLAFDEKLSGDEFASHLISNFGCKIKYYTQFSSIDKDKSKKDLIDTIANSLSKCDKKTFRQPFSELYTYFEKNKEVRAADIYFDNEIGKSAYDYFNLLDGVINSENWRNKNLLKDNHSGNIGDVTDFKEFYFRLKSDAKIEWLKKNETLTRDLHYSEIKNQPKNFIFDEENISAISKFESDLLTPINLVSKATNSNSNDALENLASIDLSKLKNSGHIKVGYRSESFLKSPIILGRERDVVFPSNETHKSFFAIVELDSIIASHNESTFASTNEYPTDESGRNINDRNYSGDINAQNKVVSVAQKLDPSIIISTSATSSGTPIITIDGVVVSGNNRTMSLKLASKNKNEAFDSYKKELYSELLNGGYGIEQTLVTQIILGDSINIGEKSFHSKGEYIKFKNPILVRIDTDFPEYTTSELNKYNKSRSKSEREIDVAIRLSTQLKGNESCRNNLINLISETESVNELYNDRSLTKRFKDILTKCGIISENDYSQYFTDISLTEKGKVLYDTLLLSLVLEAKPIEVSQNDGVKRTSKSVVQAIIKLVNNKKLDQYSIVEEVNNAILIQNDMISKGYKSLSSYTTEPSIFGEEKDFKTQKAIVINYHLNQGVNNFKTLLDKYNNSAESNMGGSMFGDVTTPNEIFEAVFTKSVDNGLVSAIERTFKDENKSVYLQKSVSSLDKARTTSQDALINRLNKALKYL